MTISWWSPETRKNSRVDQYTEGVDNVLDVSKDLARLKSEIKKNNPNLPETNEVNMTANEKETPTTREQFTQWMDGIVENIFDNYVENNQDKIKALIVAGDEQKLEDEFNTYIRSATESTFLIHKNALIAYNVEWFKFELDAVKQDVLDMLGVESGTWGNTNEENPDGEQSEEWEEGTWEEEKIEPYIKPLDLNSTEIESYTYYDFTKTEFDENGDGRISNKELKNAGIVNRYRNNNSDKNTAILGILNEDMQAAFEKSDIRGINRDDLTEILDEMLDPLTYANEHNTGNKSPSLLDLVIKYCDINEEWDYVWTDEGITWFKKEFKDIFKEKFIKTKKYKSKWIFRDTDKIADLIVTAIEGKNDPEFWDALERLADVGDAAKNMDYTSAYNDDVMLKNLKLEDEKGNDASYRVFMFLCDFDSDGIVNSTDITGRDQQNKKRRDTGSVMGGQLYTNFLQYATTERRNIDGDAKEEKVIIDGQETSDLIKNILTACSTSTENANLQQAIETFIKKQTDNSGQITMAEFMEFMKNTTYVRAGTNTETSLSSAADIKEYLKTLGEQLNEGKDLSRLFIDKKKVQNNILANVSTSNELFESRYKYLKLTNEEKAQLNEHLDLNSENQPIDFEQVFNSPWPENDGLRSQIENTLNEKTLNNLVYNTGDVQQKFDEDALEGVRNTCTYNTMKAINYVTDLIYLRLGNYPGKAIADMFSGTEFWLRYSFYNPDGTINEKEAKEALKNFIKKRTIVSVGVGVSENGHPIIGASVHWESLSEDLWDKTIKHIAGGLDIVNLLKGMSPLTFDIGIGKARQINKKNTTRLTTKKPIPVNRIGIETGINLESVRDRWLYLWLSVERDFPAGMEQKARYYDTLMKWVLFSYPEDTHIDICTSRNTFNEIMRNKITSSKNQDVLDNKEFLLDMVDKMGDEMEMTGVFELIKNNENDPELQKKILLYMYMTFIDAFHENAIEQKSYEQLAGKVKLTRFGLKTSLANILMRTGVGAGLGSVIPGFGTLVGAAAGVVVGMVTFSTRKTSYTEDASGKGLKNYTMIERGIGAENHEELLESWNKEAIADFLEKELNPNEKLLEVNIVGDKIEITAVDGTNPTLYMNAYFSADAKSNMDFSFDGKKLIIGNTSLRVSRDIKRDKVETFLMIGQEDIHDKMTLLRDSENVDDPNKTVAPLGNLETAHYKNMSYTEIETFVSQDTQLNAKKTEILWFFDTDGSLKKGLTTIPADLQGKRISVGTLTFTETPDGKTSITSYDNSTPADKMKIDYITQAKVDVSNIVKINNENYKEAVQIRTTNIFTPEDRFTKPFTEATERTLSLFDNYYNTLYRDFMVSAVDAGLDEFIDATDYNKAYTTLIAILEKNVNYANLTEVKNLIDSKTLTDADKAFIVDKFKAVFSYLIYLTDGTNDWANLVTEIGRRWNTYKTTMKWPDEKTPYPLTTDYRSAIKDLLKGEKKLNRETIENLIGFTAFYRLNGEGRKYSMTALWATKILSKWDWTKSMAEINKTDLPAAEEWFVNNLNANKLNQQKILEKLNAQLINYNITLDNTHLKSLFSWEHKTIDIWGKIVKLDLTYYFYLLGECANESIGTIINSITVYEKIKWDVTETTISGDIGGKKSKMSIQTHTVNAEYDISAKQNDLTLSAAVSGLFKKHVGEATPWESPESSNTNESVTWWEGDQGSWTFWWGD